MTISTLQKKMDGQFLALSRQCARRSQDWSRTKWLAVLTVFCVLGFSSGGFVLLKALQGHSESISVTLPAPPATPRLTVTHVSPVWLDALRRRLRNDTALLDSLHQHDTARYQRILALHPGLRDSLRRYAARMDDLIK